LASASIFFARAALPRTGYASSSVVETIGTFSLSTASNSGTTRFRLELVQSTATSGLVARIVLAMSPAIFTRSLRPTPHTSPKSIPIFAGSMSTAPTILNPLRDETWRTTPAPIGPSPICSVLIGTVFRSLNKRIILNRIS
jgi:hypothetical protein